MPQPGPLTQWGPGVIPPSFRYTIKDRAKMCSDPQTFFEKTTGREVQVACRKCNQCIATRRHGWVARAMAEKSGHSHTVCLTLTYADHSQLARDGAVMFCYADVQAFLRTLRAVAVEEAEKHNWNVVPRIRFLCAGEQGSRFGRCHWHLIIYSNFDLTRLGKFRLRGKLVSHRRDMITEGKRKRRLNWTLWRHGFMTIQEPDEAGMNYVLSYCLKDQFTHEKSAGTLREAKAENFATGLFRMSKRPAIGHNWLMREMDHLDKIGAVLPNLRLYVPDFRGYWEPSGSFRKLLLWSLVALNRRIFWATGADAPQWSSLVASCRDNESDMEIILGQRWKEEREEIAGYFRPDPDEVEFREADPFDDDRFRRLSKDQLDALGVERIEGAGGRWVHRLRWPFESGREDLATWSDADLAILNAGSSIAERCAWNRGGA